MGSGTEAAPKMPAGAHRATISSWELCPTSQPRHQGLGTPRRDTGTPGPKDTGWDPAPLGNPCCSTWSISFPSH